MKAKDIIIITTAVATALLVDACHQKTPEAGAAYIVDMSQANSTAKAPISDKQK